LRDLPALYLAAVIRSRIRSELILVRYTILHRGVPIGNVDLDLTNDPAVGAVDPLAEYESIRDQVRISTRALRTMGVGAPTTAGPTDSAALSMGAALGRVLELRDEHNALVRTDFMELADWEGELLNLTVWVRAQGAMSGSPATRNSFLSRGSDTSRPDA
jgi:hypothetical protein